MGLQVGMSQRGREGSSLDESLCLDVTLVLSFYPSVKSLLSLLPCWEISAIHILLLGLSRAKQRDGLTQSLLEVNRKMLMGSSGLQIRHAYVQEVGLSSHCHQEFVMTGLSSFPTHFSYSMAIVGKKNKINKMFAVDWSNLEIFECPGWACWGCQALPGCMMLPQHSTSTPPACSAPPERGGQDACEHVSL